MRDTRKRLIGAFLFATLIVGSSAAATPIRSTEDGLFTTIKRMIVKVLDDAAIKIGLPPG